MQNNYFYECTEQAKLCLNMPGFGEESFFNREPEVNEVINQDLSLKLRGRFYRITPYWILSKHLHY